MNNYVRSIALQGFAFSILFAAIQPEARAIVIEAEADTWIRESAPTNAYPDDLISVWDGTTTDQRRHGVIVFDLSPTIEGGTPLTIESAYLELFDRDDSRSQDSGLVQETYLLSITPPDIDPNYNWSEYTTFDQAGEQALESLGAYAIEPGDTVDGYQPSMLASAADIALLESIRDVSSNNNRVAFVLKAASGERDWGDIEYQGTPPRLVINEAVSVPGDLNADGMVTSADFDVLTDPANWLEEVPVGTRGDLTGDGFVALDDFKEFKSVYLANNPGQSLTLSVAVPEPSTAMIGLLFAVAGGLYLLATGAPGCAGHLRNRRLSLLSGPIAIRSYRAIGRNRKSTMLVGSLLSLVALPSPSQAVVLEAVSDVWIRERSPDTTYEDDLVTVWNSLYTNQFEEPGMSTRYGVVEFDLSSLAGVDLSTATLQLWGEDHGFSDETAATMQSAVVIDTSSGTPATSLTWNVYHSEYASSAVPLESLGFYSLEAPTDTGVFLNSGMASSADLSLLKSVASGTFASNQKLTMILIAEEDGENIYGHSWGDGPDGFGGMNAQLLVNELPPEVVELTLRIDSGTGEMRLVNPGIDPAENTSFEIDGYVIQSPAGALNSSNFTGLTGAGQPDWSVVDPTATAVSELSLESSLVLNEGDSFVLGNGYTAGAAEDPELSFTYSLVGGDTVVADVVFVNNAVTGDFNSDGTVDIADYTIWRDNVGATSATVSQGDADGNGTVELADYSLWKSNFGAASGAIAFVAGSAVPEPATQLLVGVAIAACMGRFFSRRGHAALCLSAGANTGN